MSQDVMKAVDDAIDENELTRDVIKSFTNASYLRHGSYDYAAGFMESAVISLIMQLPKAKRKEARKMFNDVFNKSC